MKIDDFRDEIEILLDEGLTNPEISEVLGFDLGVVRRFVRSEYGGNKNFMKRHTKHKHLRKELLELRVIYKLTNSEIRKRLNLSESEFRSCLDKAYKDKKLKKLRIQPKTKGPWNEDDLKFLLKWSGILSIGEIAKNVRGGTKGYTVKGKLHNLGIRGNMVNGLSFDEFITLFGKEPKYFLLTSAMTQKFRSGKLKLVPWCYIDELYRNGEIYHSKVLGKYIESMALFQKWIHGEDYWESLTNFYVLE